MSDQRPRVLFVCVKNGGKSQMAAALMKLRAGDTIEVHSAGTQPGSKINELSAASLAEVGVDITGEQPKPVTEGDVRAADLVVTLGRGAHVETRSGHTGRELGHRRAHRARHRRNGAHAPDPR
jgi:arsenate-mycothiol transferase